MTTTEASRRFVFIASLIALLPACGGRDAETNTEPLHTAVVCPSGVEGCSREARQAAFESWRQKGIRAAGSTFSIFAAGVDRNSARRVFCIEVPSGGWGPGVSGKKAQFIRAARQGVTGSLRPQDGLVSGTDCSGTPTTPGSNEVVVVREQGAETVGLSTTPLHQAVVCDLSTSTLGAACSDEVVLHAFDEWVRNGGTVPGATFTVWVPGQGRDSASRLIPSVVTPNRPLGARVAYLLGARHEITAKRETTGGSAIAEALAVAVEDLRGQTGRRVLLLASDLRQVTPGTWNFEARIPPQERFLQWLRDQSLLADGSSIEFRECGLHHRRGPGAKEFRAHDARQLTQVWQAAFGEMKWPQAKPFGECPTS